MTRRPSIAAPILALGLIALAAQGLHAQPEGTWRLATDPPNSSRLGHHAAVFDSVRDRMLVHAPVLQGSTYYSELWELHFDPTPAWHHIPTLGPGNERLDVGLVLDPLADRLLMFDGRSYPAPNEVLQLPLSGAAAWTPLATTGAPTLQRDRAVTFFDAEANRLLVFGGIVWNGTIWQTLHELWALSLDGTPTWTQLIPQGVGPTPRYESQIAFDATRRRIVMFGGVGYSQSARYDDVWALDVGDSVHWTQLALTGATPGDRASGGAIYDPLRDRIVIGPGYTGPPTSGLLNGTFELSMAPGSEWQVLPTAEVPILGANRSLVRDPIRDRMLGSGGYVTSAFDLAGSPAWTLLIPGDAIPSPLPRESHELAYDPVRHRTWMVGGYVLAGDKPLWSLATGDPPNWQPFVPTGGKLPPQGHSVTFDVARDRFLVFGGGYSATNALLSLSPGVPSVETLATVTPPPGRYEHSAILDSPRDRLIVFGGDSPLPHQSGGSLGDMWELPLTAPLTWHELTPPGPAPGARHEHFAFYDASHERMVVFGGVYRNGGPIRHPLLDAWALSLAGPPVWTRLDSTRWLPPVDGAVTHDPSSNRLYLFAAATPGDSSGAVWTRSAEDTATWQRVTLHGAGPKLAAPISFDPGTHRLVVAMSGDDPEIADQTWLLDLSGPTPALAALERLEAAADHVDIAWRLGETSAGALALERRTPDESWRELARLLPDGSGRIEYHDADVLAGVRYGYRLVAGTPPATSVLGEAWVETPRRALLAFAGAQPNPAAGPLRLAFTLPSDGAVRLELFDVRGARVRLAELGTRVAGAHLWEWRGAELPAGLYLARLTFGAERRVARIAVAR